MELHHGTHEFVERSAEWEVRADGVSRKCGSAPFAGSGAGDDRKMALAGSGCTKDLMWGYDILDILDIV